MPTSIITSISSRLDVWLEGRIQAWTEAPEEGRRPTLPEAKGKVNVRAIAEALELTGYQGQHLFRNDGLRYAINVVAHQQGLLPIGAFSPDESDGPIDDVLAIRLKQIQSRNNDLGKTVSEQAATIQRLRRENMALQEQLGLLVSFGQTIRIGPLS